MTGFLTRAAWRQAAPLITATWPSPVAAVQSPLLPVTQYGVSGNSRLRTHTSLDTIARTVTTRTGQDAGAVLTYELLFEGFEATWADALGHMPKRVSSTVQPATLATGVYRHRYGIDPQLWASPWTLGDGFLIGTEFTIGQRKTRRGTLAIDLADVGVWELASAMIASWELRSDPFGWFLTCAYVGHSFDLASADNTLAVVQALSLPTASAVPFTSATLKLAPYSSSTALDSGDLIEFSDFQLRCDNQLRTVQSARTGLAPEEPRRAELPVIAGQMTLPYYDDNTLIAAQRAGTHYMAELRIEGAIIASSISYAFAAWLSDLVLTSVQPTGGGAQAPGLTVAFQARTPETAAAGFPTMVVPTPIIVELVNTVATHPLL